MMAEHPVRLAASLHERPWGALSLGSWFPAPAVRTGEVWFTAADPLPLLIKFLFTTEPLSVQVHPGDNYARIHENGSPGKTEMWYILDAEPGATVALGFREPISAQRLRESALSGEIQSLLNFVPVTAGDVIFVPAGVVHAIGAGVRLLEIQQQSDVTYRLYDYGRGRQLHLDRGVEVSNLAPPPHAVAPRRVDGVRTLLATCEYFVTERWDVRGNYEGAAVAGDCHILIALAGTGTINGEPFQAGEAWLMRDAPVVECAGGATLISTYRPPQSREFHSRS